MFREEPREDLSQGDLFNAVEVPELEEGTLSTRPIQAVLLSHDCEVLNPKRKGKARHALVAEVRPASDAAEDGLWGMIEKGRVWNAFPLPPDQDGEASFVDFRRVYRVEKSVLQDTLEDGHRVASLTDDGREVIIYAYLSFLLHEELLPPDDTDDFPLSA